MPPQRPETSNSMPVIINRGGELSGVAGLNSTGMQVHSDWCSDHTQCFTEETATGAFPPPTNNFLLTEV